MSQLLKQEFDVLIRQDKNLWDTIQSKLVDGVLYIDANDFSNFWSNRYFWHVLGFDFENNEECNYNWLDYLNIEDHELIKDRSNHSMNMKNRYEQELRFTHKDGSIIWMNCRSVLIRDEEGKPHRILGLFNDITTLKQTQQELSMVTKEYEMVFEGTQDVIFLIKVNEDESFTYVRANHALVHRTGISLNGIIGKSPIDLLGPDAGMQLNIYYQRCVALREIVSFESSFDLPHGQGVWFTTLTPMMMDGKVKFIVGSSMDISDRKRLETQLIKLANHDMLTGLPNRRYFFLQLDNLIQKKQPFTILFCDLDGFKGINDVYGHNIGDELLIQVSQRLKKIVDTHGVASRFGGDEFTMIINSMLSEHEILKIKDEIKLKIEEPFFIEDMICMISVSTGVARFPDDGQTSRELIKVADSAMYQFKRNNT
jgi:diguanylate cyclase (GGDEF)-like protein/PAS domain S-box-containing protein